MRSFTVLAVGSVLLALSHLPAASQSAPPAVEQEFTAFIAKFRAALKTNDAAAIAGMTRLPFMADDAIATADQFRQRIYEEDFSNENRACLQKEKPVYDRDGENNDNYFVFCGEMIFVFTRDANGFQFTEIGVND